MVGGCYGMVAHELFPAISAGPGAYTLVGMGAMAAAVLGAPIASILILFELTGDYRIMLALMVASIVATVLINQLYKDSVYTAALRRHGIDLRSGREVGLLRHISIASIINREYETIPDTMNIKQFKVKMHSSQEDIFLVIDAEGDLCGIISFRNIRGEVFEDGLEELVLVRDIATKNVMTINPNDNLQTAFHLMDDNDVQHLPVVAENNPGQVLGVVTNHDMVRAYNKALWNGKLAVNLDIS